MGTPGNPIDLLRAALPPEFRVDGYLNAGGQGTVFRGQYRGQDVAIKLFGPNQDQRRLEREIDLLQRIDHPNVVKIRTFTTVDLDGSTCAVVAYEFLSGGDLRVSLSAHNPPITANRVLKIGADVASAVEALWQQRIVHRDIKPANIVAASSDRYVLVDVGLARHVDRSTLTLIGHTAGTHGYMSPEQARGRRSLTIRSDIFSLGVTLYELASRQHPFSRNQILIGCIRPTRLDSLRPDLPKALTGLVDQMMALVPAQRPSNLALRLSQLMGI